jgi:hypothetical protein
MGLKTGTFVNKDITSIDKVIKVLTYMNKLGELEIDGKLYSLAERDDGGITILMKFDVISNGEKSVEWLGSHHTIESFSSICNTLTEKDLVTMAATITLNSLNNGKNRQHIS